MSEKTIRRDLDTFVTARFPLEETVEQFGQGALKYLDKFAAAFYQTTFGLSDYSKQADLIDQLMLV